MKILKLDLMTILIIAVLLGVIVTMTTQAGDRGTAKNAVSELSVQAADRTAL